MTAKDAAARIRRRARRAGLAVPGRLANELGTYLELLARWNTKINLTSLADPDEAVDRLIVEPLAAVKHLPPIGTVLLDVGSGGGSPAIPIRLALPGTRLVLVEAKARKAAFLREAVRILAIGDTTVETCRVEELLTRPNLHEAFTAITIRAVSVEEGLLLRVQAFLRPGGSVYWFRGPGGPDPALTIAPPLQWEATYPLVEWLRSRLVVFRKVPHGAPTFLPSRDVPRGTLP